MNLRQVNLHIVENSIASFERLDEEQDQLNEFALNQFQDFSEVSSLDKSIDCLNDRFEKEHNQFALNRIID